MKKICIETKLPVTVELYCNDERDDEGEIVVTRYRSSVDLEPSELWEYIDEETQKHIESEFAVTVESYEARLARYRAHLNTTPTLTEINEQLKALKAENEELLPGSLRATEDMLALDNAIQRYRRCLINGIKDMKLPFETTNPLEVIAETMGLDPIPETLRVGDRFTNPSIAHERFAGEMGFKLVRDGKGWVVTE